MESVAVAKNHVLIDWLYRQ